MSTAGLIVEELDIEHIVISAPSSDDLIVRCREHMARIQALLAKSRALRGTAAN